MSLRGERAIELTAEQILVRDSPESRLCVIACAGSGKTRTAISRCNELLRHLPNRASRLALLSFSNVAVDTFRSQFEQGTDRKGAGFGRLDIDTFDGFFASHVLRPHGSATMETTRTPYVVEGTEGFLSSERVGVGAKSCELGRVKVSLVGDQADFWVDVNETKISLPLASVLPKVKWLASYGAYTHELGRYWVYRVLTERPFVLRALARRYPRIIVDEAQDINAMHQAILDVLEQAGVDITLIGDPCQGIYEFAGATGEYLRTHAERCDVKSFGLTTNFRSIEKIVKAANAISNRSDRASECTALLEGGAYWATIEKGKEQEAIAAFAVEAEKLGQGSDLAILCRSTAMRGRLAGGVEEEGRGVVASLCKAAILRDCHRDFLGAFKICGAAVLSLTHAEVDQLSRALRGVSVKDRKLRRMLWAFVRERVSGLPAADVPASTVWIELLRERLQSLLLELYAEFKIVQRDNFANRVSKANLPDKAIYDLGPIARSKPLRTSTVHKVKGESIGAVMYVASDQHARALAGGVASELGRIGYVALTRAARLFVIAIPAKKASALVPQLEAVGITKAPFELVPQ